MCAQCHYMWASSVEPKRCSNPKCRSLKWKQDESSPSYPGKHLAEKFPGMVAPVVVPPDMQLQSNGPTAQHAAELEVLVQERIAPDSQKLADARKALAEITEKVQAPTKPDTKQHTPYVPDSQLDEWSEPTIE